MFLKSNIKFFTAFILVMLLFTGCSQDYKQISQKDAVRIMKSNQNALVVDVRTPEEYEKKHIPNAVLVPIDEIRKGNLDRLNDKDQILLLYCWTGRRAEDAAPILAEKGYRYVYVFGGIVDWKGEVEGSEVDR